MTISPARGIGPLPTPIRVPGVASTGLRNLLTASETPGVVLGSSSHAVWLRAGADVAVITTGERARLPNGIHIPAGPGAEVLRRAGDDARVRIGDGHIVIEDVAVTVGRWWDPHPRLPAVACDDLAARLEGLPAEVTGLDCSALRDGLQARSAGGTLRAAASLLGRGPGLTPQGDDLLNGVLAATRLLGEAVGREAAVAWIDTIAAPLLALAAARTTAFSAALLRAARRGEIVEPAAVLLRALAGRGDVADGHRALLEFGHTSGAAIAAGIVLAARSLIG